MFVGHALCVSLLLLCSSYLCSTGYLVSGLLWILVVVYVCLTILMVFLFLFLCSLGSLTFAFPNCLLFCCVFLVVFLVFRGFLFLFLYSDCLSLGLHLYSLYFLISLLLLDFCFFFNASATTDIYTLSILDFLPLLSRKTRTTRLSCMPSSACAASRRSS